MRKTKREKHSHNPPFSRKKENVTYETRAFDGDIKIRGHENRLRLYLKGRPILGRPVFGVRNIIGWPHKTVKKTMLIKV